MARATTLRVRIAPGRGRAVRFSGITGSCLGTGRQHARPNPGLAPASITAEDAVPTTEAGWQVPAWNLRVHEVQIAMQEEAEFVRLLGTADGV